MVRKSGRERRESPYRNEAESGIVFSRDWAEQLFTTVPRYERALAQVPTNLLFGRQRREEYRRDRFEAVRDLLQEKGSEAFEEQPIWVVATPGVQVVQLIVVDGHHRVRMAGVFHLSRVTAEIVSLAQLAKYQNQLTAAQITAQLDAETSETIDSFRRAGYEVNAQYVTYDGKLETALDIHQCLDSRQLR